MTITATTRGRRRAPESGTSEPGLSFLRAVHAEWLKLASLRSSYIILAIAFLGMAGIGLLSTFAVVALSEGLVSVGAAGKTESLDTLARGIPASGIAIAQFLIASLAVMQIGSEYGTRMITTTLAVVPRRITAVLAKTLVISAASFIVGVCGAITSYIITQPLLAPSGLTYGITAGGVLPSIFATGAYLALISVLGLGVGALLRNSAGGIMATLGLLLVVPVVMAILSGHNEVFENISRYLPSAAGIQMVTIQTLPGDLSHSQGGLVVLAWAALALTGALVAVKRRDA